MREAAGINGVNPPNFHEIRSLGRGLLSEAGWKIEQVLGLMGHASASTTEHYLD
ncbi:tyrosine-type recombinase/integrase [Stenotrophomonas rhizophila]|uniref:tyrosine-type recombinase/integrase n=1 Tax=Stenotrophomonas rhizophila TaxID=216778 RepID=UPI00211B3AEC